MKVYGYCRVATERQLCKPPIYIIHNHDNALYLEQINCIASLLLTMPLLV
jgi:hypothetical protein